MKSDGFGIFLAGFFRFILHRNLKIALVLGVGVYKNGGYVLCLKKRLITLILSIGIFLSLAATAFATGQPRRYNENSTVKGTISQSFYQVNAKTDVTVKRITVTGTLYEKGTFGTWQKVSSCSNTSTSSSCSASSNYNTKPGRSYRLECSATFTYSNGQSETITSTASH